MDYTENGYNQFLLKEVDVLIANKGLNDSDLGAKEAMTLGEILDKFPDIPVSLVLGDIVANSIAANSVSTASLQAGAVTAGKIAAGAVTASSISVASLSAISATLGTVSAGTITGSTLQTGTAGENVNITSAYISLRNSAVETGYLRGYQTTDRYGAALNASEISVTDVKATRLSHAGMLMLNGGGGGTIDAAWLWGTTDASSTNRNIAIIAPTVYFSGDTTGASGTVIDLNATAADLRVRLTSGAPSGGASGSVALDTTNSRAYFKVGGTWKYAALT